MPVPVVSDRNGGDGFAGNFSNFVADHELAALRHGVARVQEKVQQDLLQTSRVADDRGRFGL